IRGAPEVAKILSGRARAAQVALIKGVTGLIWAQRGQPRVAFSFAITNGKIVMIDLTADPERLHQLDWKILKELEASQDWNREVHCWPTVAAGLRALVEPER